MELAISCPSYIDLIPDFAEKKSISQKLMESSPLVAIYESCLWRKSWLFTKFTGISFEKEYELIINAGKLTNASRVLELACGPGIYLRPIAKKIRGQGHVTGIDLSIPMLTFADKRNSKEELDNVLLIRGSALDLPFAPDTYDFINCCGALHIFTDPAKALTEIFRTLLPGGR